MRIISVDKKRTHYVMKRAEKRVMRLDAAGFSEIYEAHFKQVYNYVRYRIDSSADTEDIVSQVFMRVIEKYATYNPDKAALAAWIIGIARNRVADYFRERKRFPIGDIESLEPYLGDADEPDKRLLNNEKKHALLRALRRLNERERNIVALKYGAMLGNKEIAQVMELSESNVGVILFRSLEKMRITMHREDIPCKKIVQINGKTS